MSRTPDGLGLLVVAALSAAVASGCGTSCAEIRAHRAGFDVSAGLPTRTPHAEVALPLTLANELIAERFQRLEGGALAIPVPLVASLGQALSLDLALTGAQLVQADEGRIGVALTVSADRAGVAWFDITLDVQVRPIVDLAARSVRLMAAPADLRALRATLTDAGRAALRDWLRGVLPDSFAAALSDPTLDEVGAAAIGWLAEDGYGFLRRELLAGLAERPLLSVAIPALPVERAAVRTVGGRRPALVLELVTSLPVRYGLPPAQGLPGARAIEVRVAGDAVAALANLALSDGAVPSRYTADGEADPNGPFEARLGWELGSDRPLALHLWRTASECSYARLAGRPQVTVAGDRVVVAVPNARYQEIRGDALTEAFAWTKTVFGDAIAISIDVARSVEIAVGAETLRAAILGVATSHAEVRAAVAVTWAPRPTVTRQPGL